jgi:transcriptional regulator with XRE-family HTH domain
MKLARYLALRRMTQADFATQLGASSTSVSFWVRGRYIPRRSTMSAIVDATQGKVRASDFIQKRRGQRTSAADG